MTTYQVIFTLVSSFLILGLAGCGAKTGSGGASGTTSSADTAKNDLVGARTCSGTPPSGRTILNKWSFKTNVRGGSYQTDLNIASGMTMISVTCVVGTATKILSDSVPTHIVNNQFVISDYRNQSELINKTPCNLSVAAQTWNYKLSGNCLIMTSGNQSRTWVNTN